MSVNNNAASAPQLKPFAQNQPHETEDKPRNLIEQSVLRERGGLAVRRYRSPPISNLAPTPESSPPSAQPTRSPPVKISSAPPHPTPHLRNQLKV